MGYTHYMTYDTLPRETLAKIAQDFALLVPILAEAGAPIAGPGGDGLPHIRADRIAFNGVRQCGHAKTEGLGITWPADRAGSIETYDDNKGAGTQRTADEQRAGQWFAGALLNARTCNGNCSYETFVLEEDDGPKTSSGNYTGPYGHLLERPEDLERFEACKTAYRPYDLAVQCALIIAHHHMRRDGLKCIVASDGTREQWGEAVLLCAHELGITTFKLKE